MRCAAEVTERVLEFRASEDASRRCQRNAKIGAYCRQHAQPYGLVKLSRREIEWIRSL